MDWSDVNGGLGLAVLLVATAAERSDFRFRSHQLLPMGSFPKVAAGPATSPPPPSPASSTTATTSLSLSLSLSSSANPTQPPTTAVSNLYYEDGFAFFRRQGFNRALQAFLRCVAEFGDFAERRDPTLRLPYRIQDGAGGAGARAGAGAPTVGGLPIVFAPGSEETWTQALKYLMTDVKWLVAWSAKHTG